MSDIPLASTVHEIRLGKSTMAAKPAEIDLCRARGDTFADEFEIKNPDGTPLDITGASFLQTVDPSPDPTDSLGNLFQLTGVIVGDPILGVVSFTPTAMDTDQDPDTYFYDIQMTSAGGGIRTIAKGEYVIGPDITK